MYKKLLAALVCVSMLLSVFSTLAALAEPVDDFAALRSRWDEYLTGGDSYDLSDEEIKAQVDSITNTAQTQWDSMNKDNPELGYLWADVNDWSTSHTIADTATRLYNLALAYSTYGSSLEGNAELLDDIEYGLKWFNENKYSTTIEPYDNWYDWEIGIPGTLCNVLILLYDDMDPELRDSLVAAMLKYSPDPAKFNYVGTKGNPSSGANRVWLSMNHCLIGVITDDADKLTYGREVLDTVLTYVDYENVGKETVSDGFYDDGSFIQHTRFAYNGGYGLSLITEVADAIYLLGGTQWELMNGNIVYDWIYDSYEPFMYKGALMDMVSAREPARHYRTDHTAGKKFMTTLTVLAQNAPEEHKAAFESMIKLWASEDTTSDFLSGMSIYTLQKAQDIMENATPAEPWRGYKQFAAMDRAVYHGEDYAVGLAMYSYDRTHSYEITNSENKRGYYTAAGALYLYNDDLEQYSDDYWATAKYYRMPGTTCFTDTGIKENSKSNNFAGGTDMDDTYGISGMIYTPRGAENALTGLEARKSYFMFDDEVVALGTAGSEMDKNVETIVENRRLTGDGTNTFTVNGEPVLTDAPIKTGGWALSTNANYAHLAGNVEGADIGYYFPGGADIQASRYINTGTWKDINDKYYTTDEKSGNYLGIRFNHGKKPALGEDTYAYALLPNRTEEETKAYNDNPDIEIIKNDEKAQSVKEKTLNLTGAVFFTDETVVAGPLQSNKKATVMIKEGTDGLLDVSVSDPTWDNDGTIELVINAPYVSTVSADPTITAAAEGDKTKLTINVAGQHGSAQKAQIKVGGALTNLPEIEEPEPEPEPEPEIVPDKTILKDDFNDLTVGTTGKKVAASSRGAGWSNNKIFYADSNVIQNDPHNAANKVVMVPVPKTDQGQKISTTDAMKIGGRGNAWIAQFRLMFNAPPAADGEIAPVSSADTTESGNNFYLRVRNNSSNIFYLAKFDGGERKVGLGSKSSLSGETAQFDAGTWVDVTAVCNIDPTDMSTGMMTLYLYAPGAITDNQDNDTKKDYVVIEKEFTPPGYLDGTNNQAPFYLEVGKSCAREMNWWLDDVYMYEPNSFISSISETEDVSTTGPVEVTFNHTADVRTLTAENVSFVDAAGETVGASKVEFDPDDLSKITITPEKELKGNTEYTLDLGKVTDWVGTGALSVIFTTGEATGAEPEPEPEPEIVPDVNEIVDDAESYSIGTKGSKFSKDKGWGTVSDSFTVREDPDPVGAALGNQVFRVKAPSTNEANISTRGTRNNGLPMVVSGRIFIDQLENGSNFNLRVGDSKSSKTQYLMRIQGSSLEVAPNTSSTMPADSYKVKPGEWVNYTAYYGATQNRVVLYLTGGVTDKDGHDVPYVVQEVSATPNSAITSATGGRGPEFYVTFKENSQASYYIDDLNSYTPNSFVSSMEQATDVPVGGPITVNFNHEADVRTLTAENVTFRAKDGSTVAAQSVQIDYTDLNKLVITPAAALAGLTEYTLDLSGVKDWNGTSCLSTTFATGIGGDIELVPIETLSIEALTDNLIQSEGKAEPVVFKATATPLNVDLNTIEWYVNSQLQADSKGVNFTYTPAAAGSYVVTAKANGTAVMSNSITITVSEQEIIPITDIKLDPGEITVWADFGLPIEPKVTITPSDATNQALTWASDNTDVATVDENGNVTPVAPGTAHITATAQDAGGKVSNSFTINVTPAQNRADDQKLNLDPISGKNARIDVNEYLAWPENVGEGQVALWSGNATGAISLTVDDSLEYDFDQWKKWEQEYGFPATFFVPTKPGYIEEFDLWQDLVDNGMDVQSHTYGHLDDDEIPNLSSAQSIYQFSKPLEELDKLEGGDKAHTLAYSYGAGDENYARKFYIAARGTQGKLNKAGEVNYNRVSGVSMKNTLPLFHTEDRNTSSKWSLEAAVKTLYDPSGEYRQYGVSYYGGWFVMYSHGLSTNKNPNSDLKNLYLQEHPNAPTDDDGNILDEEGNKVDFSLRAVFDYMFENWIGPAVENGDIWLDTFTNVAKYGQERDTSKLEITNNTDSITYTLTDEMDDTLFTFPLTVKIKVDSSWENIEAVQNGNKLPIKTVDVDGSRYVLVETVPDTGAVTVQPGQGGEEPDNISIMDGVSVTRDGGAIAITSTTDMDVTVYAAVLTTDEEGYEQLKQVKTYDASLKADTEQTVEVELPVAEVAGEKAVLMIWEAGTLKPITKQIEL